MKKHTVGRFLGVVLLLVSLSVSGLALALPVAKEAINEGIKKASGTAEDYDALQQDLKQAQVKDALRRIQMLEQENRFLSKRIELLERKVDDIRTDRF